MTYVMSDLHGMYEKYLKMLDVIKFSDEDVLYILGDIIDRGPEPIEIILDIMTRPNIICIKGNHEHMALDCMRYLTGNNILTFRIMDMMYNWDSNSSQTTKAGFEKLEIAEKNAVTDFISGFAVYKEIIVNNRDYILVHAGLGNFRPDKKLNEYTEHELLWTRPDFEKMYFPDKYLVCGHTLTRKIASNSSPDRIFREKNNIAIDCGAVFGGKLACLCLETYEEFYV